MQVSSARLEDTMGDFKFKRKSNSGAHEARVTLLARAEHGGPTNDKTTEKIGRRDGDGQFLSSLV